jgi:hypothetical protein
MSSGYPNAISQAQEKAMPEVFPVNSGANNVSTKDKDRYPKNRFDQLWDQEYSANGHYQSKNR